MAGKAKSGIGPDFDDLDGQAGRLEQPPSESGSGIDPATLIGNGSGGSDAGNSDADGYVRDASGNILRNKDGSPKRKRGRKPGSGSGGTTATRAKTNNQTLVSAVDTLSLTLGGIHIALASLTKAPELKLDESESKALAQSVVTVMEQFDMTPDPRFVAVGGLIATCATIYGPRYYLIMERKKDEKKETVVMPSNVTDLAEYNFTGQQ